ncbi:MAG: alpha/beta hydrolase [Deltaproteobacteria bacterium]|nr:alpha/beta hydrolase [Deltaproteobacteria bacterium]
MAVLKRALLAALKALAVALVLFTAWILACQSSLIYFPSRDLDGTPADVGLEYESVFFSAKDGTELHGWFVPAEDERGVALLCHGNGGNISHRLDLIALLGELGLAVFAFDYRGYGRSEGSPDEEGTYLDVAAAWDEVVEKKGTPQERVLVYGRSLGGAICSHVAADNQPAGLILDSAFTSISEAGQEIYPFLPVKLLSRYDYPTVEHVERARCPVLVIHSKGDELIPYHHGQELFEAAAEPKRFVEVAGGHNENFAVSYDEYRNALQGFVDDYL